jgi:hypothetical protein
VVAEAGKEQCLRCQDDIAVDLFIVSGREPSSPRISPKYSGLAHRRGGYRYVIPEIIPQLVEPLDAIGRSIAEQSTANLIVGDLGDGDHHTIRIRLDPPSCQAFDIRMAPFPASITERPRIEDNDPRHVRIPYGRASMTSSIAPTG